MEEQEIEKTTVKQVSMKWGLILGVILIGFGIVIQIAGLIGNQAVSWLTYVFVAVIIYMAHKTFKDEGDGFMSYGQGLGLGTLVTTIAALVSSIFSYVYIKFIDDSMIEIVKELQYEKMLEQGNSEDQVEAAMEMTSSLMTPEFLVIMSLIATVFFGFILSLIISAITKNANPAEDF